jgi:hypothetical protein|tara:strand:- start:341 stop:475 length:135 start_codon:yes stop_codon:yes gene_type:complete
MLEKHDVELVERTAEKSQEDVIAKPQPPLMKGDTDDILTIRWMF